MGGTCYASGENTPTAGMVCVDGTQKACGATGNACCQDNACGGGDCCVDGVCLGNNTSCGAGLGNCKTANGGCATIPCGGSGQNCCAGAPGGVGAAANFCTGSGLACIPATGKCGTCGGSGQPCCDGNVCNAGGCCDNSAKKCIASGSACSGTAGMCTNGGCGGGTCGEIGQSCCGSGVGCTAAFMSCQSASCASCGGLGEACCVGFTGGDTVCGEPFVCDKATMKCALCGASGQDCCAGALCKSGTCSAAGKCP